MPSQTPSSSTCCTTSSTLNSYVRYLPPSSSSETATSPTRWDVFVNFRGKDTRNEYVDYVYRDLTNFPVEVFLDDRELVIGEKIKPKLMEAIQQSKMYVVVFSKDYASSTWCLEELVEIFKCSKEYNRPIIAVYYRIEPSVVRCQRESFKTSFEKHEAQYELEKTNRVFSVFTMEDINEWRRVLKAVAGLKGETIPEQRYKSEAASVTTVVNRIHREMIPMMLPKVADHPVGLDSGIREITRMLMLSTEDVPKIGIYGMGGVGKSTLARAVFNCNVKLFERFTFLQNVRDWSATKQGKLDLQRQLIRDIFKRDTADVLDANTAIKLINFNMPTNKVLIVVDDLDSLEQFNLFGKSFPSGTRIIITTRNEDLLEIMRVKEKYKVNELSDADSGELFGKHTELGDHIKSDTFTEFGRTILKRAGGLPEALTTFGNILINQETESEWEYFIDILDHHCDAVIDKCLLLSYNSLKPKDNKLQNIFQEIACSHIGKEKKDVVQALHSYKSIERRIDVLKKRSLLTISNTYMLGMHILLCTMGKRKKQESLGVLQT